MTPTEALHKLAAEGRIKSAWLPGMLLHERATPGMSLWRHPLRITEDFGPGNTNADPDLTDPATVGCLLALVREASGDPYKWVEPGMWRKANRVEVVDLWEIQPNDFDGGPGGTHGDSEGAALAAALIALASST